MQRTRLNTLFDLAIDQIVKLFNNPWRRLSLILISVFFGIFIGTAISTTAGQRALWDITMAALMLLFTEITSIIVYKKSSAQKNEINNNISWRSLFLDVINSFKIGLTYSLFLEAFKLGS
jgi:hypothetical protein